MAKNTNRTSSTGNALKIGAGLAAVGAAAAAGYYFYASPKAKNHRKIVSKWAGDMKKEVLTQTKNLEKVTPEAFDAVVDRVAKAYSIMRSVDSAEIRQAARELKSNWDVIRGETRKSVKSATKTVHKAPRKAKKSVTSAS
ncbi:MAG: hypothetical protein JWN18_457 [Parcubacteria group bacterium]|nr:hypothetical protein [Parcubacteria group bacterium]